MTKPSWRARLAHAHPRIRSRTRRLSIALLAGAVVAGPLAGVTGAATLMLRPRRVQAAADQA